VRRLISLARSGPRRSPNCLPPFLMFHVILSIVLTAPAAAMQGPGGGENDPFAGSSAQGGASLFTGAATISVPIVIPPGRVGTTPNLVLGYSSHSGLGAVGLGWSFTVGSVSRSTRNGVPSCAGAATSPPDDYRVSLSDSSNELVKVSDGVFLLEIDEAQSRLVLDPTENAWTLRTQDGLTYRFGETAESRVDKEPPFDPGAPPDSGSGPVCEFTTAWHLTRIEDPNGNFVAIEYEKDGNVPLPTQLEYAGNSEVPVAAPFRVRIESEDLPAGKPRMRTARSGVDQTLNKRIRSIVVEARESAVADFLEVRRYDLQYEDLDSTREFLLTAISTTDLPDRSFSYSTTAPTFELGVSSPISGDAYLLSRQFPTGPIVAFLDMNGDGLMDRVRVVGNAYRVAYGTSEIGVSFTSAEYAWGMPPGPEFSSIDRIGAEESGQDLYLVLDLTGDGKPDFVYRDTAQGTIRVYPGRCLQDAYDCGFSSQFEVWNNPGNLSLRHAVAYDGGPYQVGGGRTVYRDLIDMNADGRLDLVRAQVGRLEVYTNHGSGFETTPQSFRTHEDIVTFTSNPNHYTLLPEIQMIDVNGDGLLDRVEGAHFYDWQDPNSGPSPAPDYRVPKTYYAIDLDDQLHGPYGLDSGPYLCASTTYPQARTLCPGPGGYALPAGWAIVPAMSVRLNTGSGFSQRLFSPAPFFKTAGFSDARGSAPRLRAATFDASAQTSFPFRDFIDMNGDGRVDWISSGGSSSSIWEILYNEGDGHFGTRSLVRVSGASLPTPDAPIADLGSVGSSQTIDTGWHFLGETYHHSSSTPDGLSEQYAHIFDLDGDGIPELVTSRGMAGDQWNVQQLRYVQELEPHTRPLLLTQMENGFGGRTLFRYRPSAEFVGPALEDSGLPFSTWVVTGIRRTDGLCDTEPDDWFRLSTNACLAGGHETVERIQYSEGAFDAVTLEFRGFGRVIVTEGPDELAADRHIRFYQDAIRKGRIASEESYVGGLDLLRRTTFDWRTISAPPRTQVYLQEQRIEEFVLYSDAAPGTYADQCVVHRNSIIDATGTPDPESRIHTSCSMGCEGAGTSDDLCAPTPPGKKQVTTSYATPSPFSITPISDRPATVATSYVDENGSVRLSGLTTFAYDGLASGVDRGNLFHERHLASENPAVWIERFIGHDTDEGPGVGQILSVELPVSGANREPITTTYDTEFRLYPISQSSPTTIRPDGVAVAHQTETTFDLRFGKEIERVGVQGRASGDVAGAVYDNLGRPICEFEPGTSCNPGSQLPALREFTYHTGNPNASNPFDRMSWVEVRRREPEAPGGMLVTRSYRDALGRERITTNEQYFVDSPGLDGPSAMGTVVRRHIEYGPNGRVSRRFTAYLPGPSGLSLTPPNGTSAIELDYVLNENQNGFWDPLGRPGTMTQYDLSTQREGFYGRTTQKVDALGDSTFEHVDAHGRLVRREVFDSTSIVWHEEARYDGRDRAVREWVGGDVSTEVISDYDLLGRLVSRQDPNSGTWSMRFDAAGNEVFRNDPELGQSVQRCYDPLDRIVLECARTGDDFDPNLCSTPEPSCSIEHRFVYDEPDSIGAVESHAVGRLSSVDGPGYSTRLAYDVRGRIVHQVDEIEGISAATQYAHDAAIDRLEEMIYPDGEVVRYGYDPSGQPQWLASLDGDGAWQAYYVSNVRYDFRGRVVSLDRGNSTRDEYTYHDASEDFRVDQIVVRNTSAAAGGPLSEHLRIRYADYDGNGRLTRISDERISSGPLSLSAEYGFDAVGRLVSVDGPNPETFGYDALGNIIAINAQPFTRVAGNTSELGPHQFDRFGDPDALHWAMGYDANGQRTSKYRSDGSIAHTYAFDATGRLTTLTVNGVSKTFRYDASGRRISETRDGVKRRSFGGHAESENGNLHKFYFIGETLIATRTDEAPALSDAKDVVPPPIVVPPMFYWALMSMATLLLTIPLGSTRRTIGVRVSQGGALGTTMLISSFMLPLALGTGCSEIESIRHFHLSQRSSPIVMTRVGGQLDRQYRYSAYGEVRRYDATGEPIGIDSETRREFTGYQTDKESELQYAGARYYDPSQAQFLSMDPKEQNASPYAYAAWDPIDFTDPTGQEAFTLAFLVFVAVSLAALIVQAIITGVQTSSWSNGFTTLALGVGTLTAGTITGMILPGALAILPGISQVAVRGALLATGVGTSTYGVTTAGDTANAVAAGIGLALSLGGAAYGLVTARDSGAASGASDPLSSASNASIDGIDVAANGSNRTTLIEQMLKILRGNAEARIIRAARLRNDFEIAALRGEAARSQTVRGRAVGDNNVTAFEVTTFTVDSAGNRSFNDSIVAIEFSGPTEPVPTRPTIVGGGNLPFVRTVLTGPHPIACGACPPVVLP
jgi:RHS repeat-associated protein